MDSVPVELDSTLACYTGGKEVVVEIAALNRPITVHSVLKYLRIPPGMVGGIVNGKSLLCREDVLDLSCEPKLFGIYSGG